jgi:hypothetical protein
MKSLQEYIITEGIVFGCLFCLLAGLISRYTIKGINGAAKTLDGFWDWVTGKPMRESLNEELDDTLKFDKNDVKPVQIIRTDVLEKVIAMSEPKSGKNKKGFYYFNNLLKEHPELKKINKGPYFAMYCAFMGGITKDDNKKPDLYGLVGFSIKFWEMQIKKAKTTEAKEFAEKHKDYINIFAVQTDPKYAKNGLLEIYLNSMKSAVKETHMTGLTIYCEDPEMQQVYERYGFEKTNNPQYMSMKLFNKKNKDEKTK